MTTCIRCHRPLKHPTESGLGPVCAKNFQPVAEVERDLFGYDIEAATVLAKMRLANLVLVQSVMAKQEIRIGFIEARARLGVLA